MQSRFILNILNILNIPTQPHTQQRVCAIAMSRAMKRRRVRPEEVERAREVHARLQAAGVERRRAEIDAHRLIHEALERYIAKVRIDGVVSFKLLPEASTEYLAMQRQIQAHQSFGADKYTLKHVDITTPVWIAELDNGNILIQCANRGSPPTEVNRYVVFYGTAYPQKIMPCPLSMTQSISGHPYSGAATLPSETQCIPPIGSKMASVTADFYRRCPRQVVLSILAMFWTAKVVVMAELKDKIPDHMGLTVFDLLQQVYAKVPPPLLRLSSSVYKPDNRQIRRDVAVQDKFVRYLHKLDPLVHCPVVPKVVFEYKAGAAKLIGPVTRAQWELRDEETDADTEALAFLDD